MTEINSECNCQIYSPFVTPFLSDIGTSVQITTSLHNCMYETNCSIRERRKRYPQTAIGE